MRQTRWTLAVLAMAALVVVPVTAPAGAERVDPPEGGCDSLGPIIRGSGIINGTNGGDVIWGQPRVGSDQRPGWVRQDLQWRWRRCGVGR